MIAGVLEGDQRVRKPRACFHAERHKVVIVEDVFDVFFNYMCFGLFRLRCANADY